MGTIAELVVRVRAENSAFNSGLDDVSKRARKTKGDVEDSFNFNTDGASKGFGDIRHSLGLLDNSIRGAHGAAMADVIRLTAQWVDISAALPFAAMAGGAILVGEAVVALVKKFQEMRQESEKLRNAETVFDTTVGNTFNSLRDKLLQAGIRADDLNNNHLAALKKQLQLIDHQSMDDLSHSFDTVKKAADEYFKQLEAHWYSFGIGSAGAKHALDDFQIQYNALLAKGDKAGANDKLIGSLQQWEHLLALQKEAKAAGDKIEGSSGIFPDAALKFERDRAELKKYGLGITDDEIKSQEKLVAVGHDLLDIQKLEEDRRTKERGTAIETGKKADLDQQVSDAKKASDAETKEYIAGLELQLSQFKITQTQFEQLKQAALDKQFNDELAHLEKLKALYAGQPEMLKQVNAQEDALAAEHNAQIIADATKTFNEQTRLMTELGKFSAETAQKQAEEQNKANAQAMKAIEEKNKVLLDDLKTIDAAGDNRVKQINREIENLRRLKEQYQLTGKTKLDIDNKIHALQQQRDKDINDEMMKSGKLGKIFHATLNEMITDGLQWRTKLADTFKQTVGEMNRSLSQFLVEGQGNWKQFAVGAIESIVQIGLQYAESKAMMAILDAMGLGEKKTKNAAEAQSSANTAAANTLADVPFPANIPASAAVLSIGEAFSVASMAAEQGAVLPNREALVHTHPQEMILPQHISNFIQRGAAMAMGRGGRGGGGHTFNIHLHDVTDGQGIERMVTKQVIPIIRRELSWGRA